MTATVNEATKALLESAAGDVQLAVDLAVIAALFSLLLQTELLRAAGRLRAGYASRVVDVAVGPLVIAFLVIVILRGAGLR